MIKKAIVFIVVLYIAMQIGGAIAYGLMSFVGLIALIETIPLLKWIVIKATSLIDILIFAASIAATLYSGYNISASLVLVGLGYTLVYAPYVRHQAKAKRKPQKRNNPASGYDWS